MKFCPECGNNIEGVKFCSNCGFKVEEGSKPQVDSNDEAPNNSPEETILKTFSTYMFGLENQKATLGKFDVSLPRYNYTLTNERLILEKQGVVTKKNDYIELYLVKDIVLHQKMKDKIMKVGDLEIVSVDTSTPNVVLKRIQDPQNIREILRDAIRNAKRVEGVSYRQEL